MAETTLKAAPPSARPRLLPRAIQASGGTGRDSLAIIALLLIVVTVHIQNPLLQFETQFGRAFRNASLQPVLALGLALVVGLFIHDTRAWRSGFTSLLGGVLAAYSAFIVLAVVVHWHALAPLVNLPVEVFEAQVRDDSLRPALETALSIALGFEALAIAALVLLWSPWERLTLYRQAVQRNAPVLLVALIVLIAWEVLIVVLRVQEFFIPRPSRIFNTLVEIYPRLVTVSWNTFQNAIWGYIFGCGLGFLTGVASARFVSFSRALLPVAIALNSVPIIAFAPIVNNWFGALNPASKMAIVAIMTYFPTMISTVRGLNSVTPLQLELMRSYAANPSQVFRKLRLPSSLPFVFSALKVGTTASMIGAIVSEYFGGTTQGLGYRIREDAANFKYPDAWAAIIIASLLGILFYSLVSAVERRLMPWQHGLRDE